MTSNTRARGRPSRLDAPDFTPELIAKIRDDLASELISYTEAAKLYDVPRQTLYRLVRGELKGHES